MSSVEDDQLRWLQSSKQRFAGKWDGKTSITPALIFY